METPTQKMVGDRMETAIRQLLATATGKRRRDLEARLAEIVAHRAAS